MRGAYGEVGRDDFCDEGEPRPDIPDTLYLLPEEVDIVGRVGTGGAPLTFNAWRLEVEVEVEAEVELGSAGGVTVPYMEFKGEDDFVVVPLEPPLLESVLGSVRKLAFERLRKSFKNEGAMIYLPAHE